MTAENNGRTGLWKKESNNGGAPYYGGSVTITEPGEYWVNLYKNDKKESDKHPDLNLVLKPKEARQEPQRSTAPKFDEFSDSIDF